MCVCGCDFAFACVHVRGGGGWGVECVYKIYLFSVVFVAQKVAVFMKQNGQR
jgi:hypothetical protein